MTRWLARGQATADDIAAADIAAAGKYQAT
jgi:hypothetical protein